MSDQWVCNASPLILLKHIGRLRPLTDLCDILVVPKGVANEILKYKEEAPTLETFLTSPKVTRIQSDITIKPAIAGWDLGQGEGGGGDIKYRVSRNFVGKRSTRENYGYHI